MHVLLINGSPHEKGCTYTALSEVAARLSEHGIDSELFWIGREAIGGCTGCGACRRTEGCVLPDGIVRTCAEKLRAADGLIVGSPVHFAGPSANLCALLDRLFYSHSGFAGKPAAAVVSCRRGGASAAFDRLNKYLTISHMPLVPSQYWNSVHGNTPEEVKQDLEGLQTMRALAENMAWLLKCIAAGRAAGVPEPVYEPRLRTNFIR